jgi:hypothetical protein
METVLMGYDDMLTAARIADRPGWTRSMVELAFPDADGTLDKKYNFAPLYAISRIEEVEKSPEQFAALQEKAAAQAIEDAQKKKAVEELRKQKQQRCEERKAARLQKSPPICDATIRDIRRLNEESPSDIITASRDQIQAVFTGSNAPATRGLYKELEASGGTGVLAAYLLRAQKSSTRAKDYRGDYRDLAYGNKGDALHVLSLLLQRQSALTWGWGTDPGACCEHVLYVDLPTGQVSFHSPVRGEGPNYAGKWSGRHDSQWNIIAFAALVRVINTPISSTKG